MCTSGQVVKILKVFNMPSKCLSFFISTCLNIYFVQSAVSVSFSFNSFSSMQVITRIEFLWVQKLTS